MRTRGIFPGLETPVRREYAIATLLAAALLPALFVFAVLWVAPVGEVGADRTAMAARDYTDMWAAGRLVALGKSGALSNVAEFNAALRSMFGAGFPNQVWPYPPPILLLAVPLSSLPLLAGFVLYTAGTSILLYLALRLGGLTTTAGFAVLFSPAAAENALTGQNASLTAALLFGGLLQADRRPGLAGAILGLLVIKPQGLIIIPLCLIASRNWRALLFMTISATVLTLLSGILFGFEIWSRFFVQTQPVVTEILTAPWHGLPSQQIFASWFMAARSIGTSVQAAWYLQVSVALVCATVAWRAWRTPTSAPVLRAALTGLLGVAAAPWVHTYDMIPLSVAIVLLFATARGGWRILLGFSWFWPGAVLVLPIPLPLSVASVAAVACLVSHQIRFHKSVSEAASRGGSSLINI